MTEIQNLNKHAIVCMIIFLLMVLFFLQPRVFSQLFQTILGRAFLVILIVYITYCNQIWGVLFVLFLMIMHTNDSIMLEGLTSFEDAAKATSVAKESSLASTSTTTQVETPYSQDPAFAQAQADFLAKQKALADSQNGPTPDYILKAQQAKQEQIQYAIANPTSPQGIAFVNYAKANLNTPEGIAYTQAQAQAQEQIDTQAQEQIDTQAQEQAQAQAQEQIDAQAREDAKNLIKTLTPTPKSTYIVKKKKTFTCTENFKPLEGFDLLGLEDNMKRGKQSNSIQVGNSYNNNSDNVMPYEESFFSPFQF